jgi:hypothetical protein
MPGASGVKAGDPVFVNIGGGDKIGLVFKGEHEQGDGTLKAHVQLGREIFTVGYREPKERDDHGAGGTFWLEGIGK